ncbi:MAG TPA: transposase, partial [Anaerolineaceae bacterium]|nr:transposase [Anaerolineaceae bacterium]
MKYDPEIHHRRSIRLQGYDYSQDGTYFVTLCTHNRENMLGEIKNGEMVLNEYGKIVSESWEWLSVQYDYIELDAWVIMPNHMHGIIVINHDGGGRGGF